MELYQSNHVSATSNQIDKNINQFDDGWEEVPSKQFRRKKRTPISPLIKIDQYIIILCGIPGSGKSEFAQKLCRLNPLKFVRVSQDVLGSRKKCENACRQSLRDGRIPIIDRCNFDSSQRIHFLSIAAEHKVAVDCIVFQYSRQDCIDRCMERSSHETVHRGNARSVVSAMVNQFSPPMSEEKFRVTKYVTSFRQADDIALNYHLD